MTPPTKTGENIMADNLTKLGIGNFDEARRGCLCKCVCCGEYGLFIGQPLFAQLSDTFPAVEDFFTCSHCGKKVHVFGQRYKVTRNEWYTEPGGQ